MAAFARPRPTGAEPQPPNTSLLPLFTRDISVIGFVISLATTTELADAAQAINRRLASGGFTTKATSTMPLDMTAEAHALVESRQSARAIIQIGRQPRPEDADCAGRQRPWHGILPPSPIYLDR